MKTRLRIAAHRSGRGGLAAALLLGILLITGAPAQASAVQLELKPSSQLWLEGKSTLHPFSSKATQIQLTLDVMDKAGVPAIAKEVLDHISAGNTVSKLTVDVPVKGLKSGKGALDDNLYTAVKAGDFPRISFRFTKYKMLGGPSAEGVYTARVTGVLTIAGKSRTVDIDVAAQPQKDAINVWGTERLKMTEYGITPPTAMMGMIRTEDDITVNFDLTLGVRDNVAGN